MSVFAYLLEFNRYLNIAGIFFILSIAYAFSQHKRLVNKKIIIHALLMQFVLAFFALKTSTGQKVISVIASGVTGLYTCASEGVTFLFGALGINQAPWGSVFAIQILPMIIFFGAFMSLLFHLGIVQRVVAGIGYVVRPLLGTSGAETLCAIANSFLGQTEAPLLIKNYLQTMTKSELLVVMVSGMGTISGSIMAVYASMGAPIEHLLAASIMAIPASIMIAKILLPETEKEIYQDSLDVTFERKTTNIFDALSQGTSDGLQLALNVAAMLLSFIAMMFMVNGILGFAGNLVGLSLSLDGIFAFLFRPFSFFMGFTGQEAVNVAELLGTKVGVNEFVAYLKMVQMNLSPRALALTTYALCGFSNFSCIGIQVGGIGALVPSKRKWLTELGLYAVLGGALSNMLTAFIAGLFI